MLMMVVLFGFNSRTPGGVRLRIYSYVTDYVRFNSRTPGGVRLSPRELRARLLLVSIHAPREGCDYSYGY